MAEPQTTKGRATRERVIDTAAALVFERGVAGTSLDDVRARAHVSKGQLYHYFADKDDLVHAVVERTIEQVLAAQPELADLSSWRATGGCLDALVALQRRRRGFVACPIGALASELANHDD